VTCGYPGGVCTHVGALHQSCTDYEVEPFGFYLFEHVFDRDIGFAYTSGEDCR
jgi:hypothetical protein